MALLSRVYFNAVFGAIGGLIGWMLFGVFGRKVVAESFQDYQALLGGALIGGSIGYFVVSVEAIRDRSFLRFVRLATFGLVLGALGGAPGMWVGDLILRSVNAWVLSSGATAGGSMDRLASVLARGVGWMILGSAVGMSEGIASWSLGKFSYGTVGGALGGFLGGCLFGVAYTQVIAASDSGSGGVLARFWGGLGLVILGACIGALSALVRGVFQPASVRVLRGWQEGREYPLENAENSLGRDEQADIALFRDMKVAKRHAAIRRDGKRFILVNLGADPEQTRVNDEPVVKSRVLHEGDRIQLGGVLLRFQNKRAKTIGRDPKGIARK